MHEFAQWGLLKLLSSDPLATGKPKNRPRQYTLSTCDNPEPSASTNALPRKDVWHWSRHSSAKRKPCYRPLWFRVELWIGVLSASGTTYIALSSYIHYEMKYDCHQQSRHLRRQCKCEQKASVRISFTDFTRSQFSQVFLISPFFEQLLSSEAYLDNLSQNSFPLKLPAINPRTGSANHWHHQGLHIRHNVYLQACLCLSVCLCLCLCLCLWVRLCMCVCVRARACGLVCACVRKWACVSMGHAAI